MRILVLIHEYPPIGGGGGRVAQDLARALSARGHEVRVIAPAHSSVPPETGADGVQVIRIRSFRRREFSADIPAMLGYLAAGARAGLREVRRWKPDVIHVHFAVPAGALAWLLSKWTGVPYVLTAHLGDVPGGVPEKTDRWFRWVLPFSHAIWRDAAHVTAISEFTRRLALRHYPVPIEFLPNGTPLPKDPPQVRPHALPQILFTGRFVPQKNPLLAVRILSRVADLPWQARLVGDGALLGSVRAEIDRLGLQDRVQLTGWLPPEEVNRLFEEADILLMPSVSEGIPMAGLHALGAGLALVASRVGGLGDLVDQGRSGFLHAPDDEDGFVTSLRLLLSDPARLQEARRSSLGLALNFDLERIADRYEAILTEAAGKRA